MAGASSSSAADYTCFHCKKVTSTFKNGWRLRCGDLAQLCERCGYAYDNGTFCDIFHMDSDGWRDCLICQKMLHCGCIVSRKRIVILDYGGICCVECSKKYQSMPEIDIISSKACPQYWHNLRAQLEYPHSKVELSVDSEEPMTETNAGSNSVSPVGLAVPPALAPETDVKPFIPGPPDSADNFLSETFSSSDSEVDSASCCAISSRLINSHHLPKMSKGENLKLLENSSSGIIPLFEKVLTASDTDLKKSRLVNPKKYAKAYFPEIHEPLGMKLEVQDTTGRNWKFNYRCWLNSHSMMYVLGGLKDYMVLMQWQAGDIVTFSLIQPEGKLLMGTKKPSTFSPPLEELNEERQREKKELGRTREKRE